MIADFIKGKRILLAALISGIAIAAIYAGLQYLIPDTQLYMLTGLLVAWLTGLLLLMWRELHVHIRKQTLERHRWQEAWDGIRDILTFYHPLPPSTTFTIAPDAALYLLRHIMEQQPRLIVELGGGLSTILMAKLIKSKGFDTRIITIESDAVYGEALRKELQQHGVEDLTDLRICPIEPTSLGTWYSIAGNMPKDIDLLLIDGPPKAVAKDSRYPAFPYFEKYLSADASVIADDADRPDMLRTISRWQQKYTQWNTEWVRLSRTIAVFRRG